MYGYVFRMDVFTDSPQYQVLIPKRVREQFDLKPGQVLQVIALPGRIVRTCSADCLDLVCGLN